jgi:GMP reductase
MLIEPDIKLDFDDVLLRPKRSLTASRADIDLKKRYQFLHSKQEYYGVPIIAANLDTTGTFAMADIFDAHHMMVALHKYYEQKELFEHLMGHGFYHVFYTIGISNDELDRLVELDRLLVQDHCVPKWHICIDIAQGHSQNFVNRVKKVRATFPDAVIMAGNVCVPDMVQELLLGGADIVKVGIGPGSLCSTRMVAGVGMPQLSAIIECADAAHGNQGHICADGGCKTPGDVVKAFGAGADFVMLGGMLAGTDECEGEWVYHEDAKYVKGPSMPDHPGLTLDGIQVVKERKRGLRCHDKYGGGDKGYRASEGIETEVPYKGPVADVLREITGGLRSACSYVGAKSLKDLPKCTTFIRVNRIK